MTQPAQQAQGTTTSTTEPKAAAPAGTQPDPAAQQPATGNAALAAPAKGDDKPLGEAGLKALQAEREARQALEKQVAALAPLAKLADALGVQPAQGKTDVETLTSTVTEMRNELAKERTERLRLEVAAEKGLTPAQAARLQGGTREELAADADALKTLFPSTGQAGTTATGQPGTPAPDPSQGARGGANDLKAAIAAAQQKGDVRESIRLKQELAAQQRK